METTKIIEINGIKMEVDLRHVKVIENYKVGDHIKVLVKDYDTYKSYIGIIIGFDDFENTPTVVIAYLKTDYGQASIQMLYFNKQTKDAEITSLNNWDIPVTKTQIINRFNEEVKKKETEIEDIKNKSNLFEELFGKYFEMKSNFSSEQINGF